MNHLKLLLRRSSLELWVSVTAEFGFVRLCLSAPERSPLLHVGCRRHLWKGVNVHDRGVSQISDSNAFAFDKKSPRDPFRLKASCVFQSNCYDCSRSGIFFKNWWLLILDILSLLSFFLRQIWISIYIIVLLCWAASAGCTLLQPFFLYFSVGTIARVWSYVRILSQNRWEFCKWYWIVIKGILCEPVGLGTTHNITAFILLFRVAKFWCFRPTYFLVPKCKRGRWLLIPDICASGNSSLIFVVLVF